MIKSISISELTIGMYVENVVKQKGNVRIKSRGLVKTQSILDALKSKGILEIEVDFAKSRLPESDTKDNAGSEQLLDSDNNAESNSAADIGQLQSDTLSSSVPMRNNIKIAQIEESSSTNAIKAARHQEALEEADKLYSQAKNVQKSFLSQLRSGSTPNIDDLNNLSQDIIESVFDNTDALSCLLMLKDSNEYLVEHAINCAILLAMFARAKNMSEAEVEDLTNAGLLMDVGMASLPRELVAKTGKLNEAEWAKMKTHVDIGVEIAEGLVDPQPIVLDVIANHHERINGSGYPNAKTASEISVYSQMAAIVDCYDAMISNRHHRRSVSATAALQELERDETLDRDLVTEFINAIGLHPVGSLVELHSKHLGIVSKRNRQHPLDPVVMIFYSLQTQLHTDVQRVDLLEADDHIVTGVRPEEFSMNLGKFFKKVFLSG